MLSYVAINPIQITSVIRIFEVVFDRFFWLRELLLAYYKANWFNINFVTSVLYYKASDI